MTTLRVEDAARRLIEVKDKGWEALEKEFNKIANEAIANLQSQIKIDSERSVFALAVRQADDFFAALAEKVFNHGILLSDSKMRDLVDQRLINYRTKSPYDSKPGHYIGWAV